MLIKVRNYRFNTLLLALLLLLGLAGITSAAEFWLKSEAFTKTMPGSVVVTMWGFSQCTDGTYTTCGAPSSPGPTLVVPDNDPSLTINVKNGLTGLYTEPVSLMIPGQTPATMVPVRNTDGRVRSFTNEAAVGGTAQYIWPVFRPGTFLYQSATHPGLQIPMGLSGVVKKDAAPGAVYAGITYNTEVILVFSEIDPALHKAVEGNNYGPGKTVKTTTDYNPRFFLINGAPYTPGRSPIPAGSVGQTTLLRFLNAGADDYTPVLQGQHMNVIAEDSNPLVFPREQYALLLPAARTFDAIFTPLQVGYLPLYDRRLHVYNAGASPGGMLLYLDIADQNQFTLSVTDPGAGGQVVASSLPGGIECGLGSVDCSESYHANIQMALTATAAPGNTFLSWTGVDAGTELSPTATVTMDANKTVTANFLIPPPGKSTFLTLKRPNSGKVKKSKPYTIKWKYTVDPGPTIKIELFQNDQIYYVIEPAAPFGTLNKKGKGKGSFVWTVSPLVIEGTGFKIKITSNTNPAYTDGSNKTFKIVP